MVILAGSLAAELSIISGFLLDEPHLPLEPIVQNISSTAAKKATQDLCVVEVS
jgi:hypothetical protein